MTYMEGGRGDVGGCLLQGVGRKGHCIPAHKAEGVEIV